MSNPWSLSKDILSNETTLDFLSITEDFTNANLGISVAISEDYAFFGARGKKAVKDGAAAGTNEEVNRQGAVYVFKKDSNGNWNKHQKLTSTYDTTNNAEQVDFGYTCNISGNYAIIGERERDVTRGSTLHSNCGNASIWELNTSTGNWEHKKDITDDNNLTTVGYNAKIGHSVSISGNYAVVSSTVKRTVYVSKRDENGNWSVVQELTTSATSGNYGYSVSIGTNYLMVGAPSENKVYLYKVNSQGTWEAATQATIQLDSVVDEDFGWSVDLNGDYAIFGARAYNSSKGRAHIFKFNSSNSTWTFHSSIQPDSPDDTKISRFGFSSAINDKYAIVGSDSYTDTNSNQGAAFIFKLNSNDVWEQEKVIKGDVASMKLGTSVAIYQNIIVSGAPNKNQDGVSGAGYANIYKSSESYVTLSNPVVQSVEIKNESPSTLEFTFDQTILDNTEIRYEDFSVTVDGTSKSLGGIQIKNGKLYLTLDERIFSDNTVLVSFTKPGTAHVANLTIDSAGDYALQSFTDQAVTNSTTSLSSSITISTQNIIDNTYTVLTNDYAQYTDRTNLGSSYVANQLKKSNDNYYTNASNPFIVTSHGGNVNKSLADPPKIAFPQNTSDSSLDEVYIDFSQQKIINALKIGPYWDAHTTVKEIRIYGSNDNNATKTLIETINIPLQPNKSTFTINFSNATSYKKYTFQFTQGWVRTTTPTNWSYLIFSLLQVFHKQTILEIAESDATSANLSSNDINTIKTGSFTISNGKSTLDNTRKQRLKDIMTNASNATDKRKKRRAALKLLFAQDQSLTKMVIPKTDLDLPEGFTKTNALVVKAGETFSISDLDVSEGFYSVLNDGESVNLTTDNTTLTFTREDFNDEEIYEVESTTSWDDIVINSDNVTGTFDSQNTTGSLKVEDNVIIDGRIFIIGSVADGGSSGSGADPYVFPINSSIPVKLPNKPAFYRMFEQGNNYINVEVDAASEEHKSRMNKYASNITPVTHNIIMDGYFYKKAFISAEGHKLTLDYNTKNAICSEESINFFNIKQSKKIFDCGEFKENANCWTIQWNTIENKKIQVQIMFFPNPHIENGINVIPTTLKNSLGLIVDNYKPKMMEIPSLTTEKFGKLRRRLAKSKRIYQKMNIKSKNEKWHFKN